MDSNEQSFWDIYRERKGDNTVDIVQKYAENKSIQIVVTKICRLDKEHVFSELVKRVEFKKGETKCGYIEGEQKCGIFLSLLALLALKRKYDADSGSRGAVSFQLGQKYLQAINITKRATKVDIYGSLKSFKKDVQKGYKNIIKVLKTFFKEEGNASVSQGIDRIFCYIGETKNPSSQFWALSLPPENISIVLEDQFGENQELVKESLSTFLISDTIMDEKKRFSRTCFKQFDQPKEDKKEISVVLSTKEREAELSEFTIEQVLEKNNHLCATPEFFRWEGPKWIDFKKGFIYKIPDIDRITNDILNGEKEVVIWGNSATGKTTTIVYIGYLLSTQKRKVYFIDFMQRKSFEPSLFASLGERDVLIIDNAHLDGWDNNYRLDSLRKNNKAIKIIATRGDASFFKASPFSNFAMTLKSFPEFSSVTTYDESLLNLACKKLEISDRDKLWTEIKKIPACIFDILIFTLCVNVYKKHNELNENLLSQNILERFTWLANNYRSLGISRNDFLEIIIILALFSKYDFFVEIDFVANIVKIPRSVIEKLIIPGFEIVGKWKIGLRHESVARIYLHSLTQYSTDFPYIKREIENKLGCKNWKEGLYSEYFKREGVPFLNECIYKLNISPVFRYGDKYLYGTNEVIDLVKNNPDVIDQIIDVEKVQLLAAVFESVPVDILRSNILSLSMGDHVGWASMQQIADSIKHYNKKYTSLFERLNETIKKLYLPFDSSQRLLDEFDKIRKDSEENYKDDMAGPKPKHKILDVSIRYLEKMRTFCSVTQSINSSLFKEQSDIFIDKISEAINNCIIFDRKGIGTPEWVALRSMHWLLHEALWGHCFCAQTNINKSMSFRNTIKYSIHWKKIAEWLFSSIEHLDVFLHCLKEIHLSESPSPYFNHIFEALPQGVELIMKKDGVEFIKRIELKDINILLTESNYSFSKFKSSLEQLDINQIIQIFDKMKLFETLIFFDETLGLAALRKLGSIPEKSSEHRYIFASLIKISQIRYRFAKELIERLNIVSDDNTNISQFRIALNKTISETATPHFVCDDYDFHSTKCKKLIDEVKTHQKIYPNMQEALIDKKTPCPHCIFYIHSNAQILSSLKYR